MQVGGAGVHMNEHRLALSGRKRIAARHVHRNDFMRAQNDLRVWTARLVPAREFLDQ
jgi:hypothetical protein